MFDDRSVSSAGNRQSHDGQMAANRAQVQAEKKLYGDDLPGFCLLGGFMKAANPGEQHIMKPIVQGDGSECYAQVAPGRSGYGRVKRIWRPELRPFTSTSQTAIRIPASYVKQAVMMQRVANLTTFLLVKYSDGNYGTVNLCLLPPWPSGTAGEDQTKCCAVTWCDEHNQPVIIIPAHGLSIHGSDGSLIQP